MEQKIADYWKARAEKAEAQRDDWKAMHRHAQQTIADLNGDLKGQRARAEKAEAQIAELREVKNGYYEGMAMWRTRAEKAEAESDLHKRQLDAVDSELKWEGNGLGRVGTIDQWKARAEKAEAEAVRLRQHVIDEGMRTTIQILNAKARAEKAEAQLKERKE